MAASWSKACCMLVFSTWVPKYLMLNVTVPKKLKKKLRKEQYGIIIFIFIYIYLILTRHII